MMAAILANPVVRDVLIGLGLAVAMVTGFLYFEHTQRNIGAEQEKAKQTQQINKVQERINDAESKGPRTPSDVTKRMRDGRF